MASEVHVFVIWPFAMSARARILGDIAAHAEIVATVDSEWPAGVTAEAGYRRFYGALLPDAVGKVKRAGAGRFCVVIVRIAAPRYDWRMTQRGLELVNLDMFDMKWRYREWVGGLHRVHGTNSVREARRDIMLLTGRTLEEWTAGRVRAGETRVLPGQGGWRGLREVFAFLNEVHPYAVLRNAEGLPDAFDPVHDDVDLLVESAKECVSLLGAVKAKGGGAAHWVRIAGARVKFDLREIGDDYYDTAWEREMLARRRLNAAGVFELEPQDALFALYYHAVSMKPRLAADYPGKLAALARRAGFGEMTIGSGWAALERFLFERGYRFTAPKDPSVHLNRYRVDWRRYGAEAQALFGLTAVRPDLTSPATLELTALMDGRPVRVVYSPNTPLVSRGYDLQAKVYAADPTVVARPLMWHTGSKGAYLVTEDDGAGCLGAGANVVVGQAFAPSVRKLVAALDRAGVVHRAIAAEALRVGDDGAVRLADFGWGVDRAAYKSESPFLRRRIARCLVPLGGEGVERPGVWNDRLALARVIRAVSDDPRCVELATELEEAARSGRGRLVVRAAKLRLRVAGLWLEIALRSLVSPRRRKSAAFVRIRVFAHTVLFGAAGGGAR